MRRRSVPSLVYFSELGAPHLLPGWLQAGFSSFAYRLAHLLPFRAILVVTISAVFVIF